MEARENVSRIHWKYPWKPSALIQTIGKRRHKTGPTGQPLQNSVAMTGRSVLLNKSLRPLLRALTAKDSSVHQLAWPAISGHTDDTDTHEDPMKSTPPKYQ
jgi:hypothetical protein